MHKLLLLLSLIIFTNSAVSQNYPYEYSVCAMFKDDADYLPEWIEYHRLLGFEHFWLFNNNSSDHYLKVLAPYIYQNIVELIEWPSPPNQNWIHIQHLAYNEGIRRTKNKTKWLAVIDTDEFIVPVDGKESFHKTMKRFEQIPDCGGILLFWLMYGTSFVYEIPQGKTLVESLLLRSSENYFPNLHVKTICRPERVSIFQIHVSHYHAPYRDYTINEKGDPMQPVQKGPVETSPIRINHYWTRTQKYFDEVKLPRRVIFNSTPYTQEDISSFETELNAEFDDSILQYVPELKKRLKMPL